MHEASRQTPDIALSANQGNRGTDVSQSDSSENPSELTAAEIPDTRPADENDHFVAFEDSILKDVDSGVGGASRTPGKGMSREGFDGSLPGQAYWGHVVGDPLFSSR
jgi:hypothetical protein